jgi:hypothetical protein
MVAIYWNEEYIKLKPNISVYIEGDGREKNIEVLKKDGQKFVKQVGYIPLWKVKNLIINKAKNAKSVPTIIPIRTSVG